jgi:hypothetical protein
MSVTIKPATNQSVVIQPGVTSSAVSVTSPANGSSLTVNQGGTSPAGIIIRKSTGGTLTSLGDVNSSSVQDGFTLVYDSDTNKWIAQEIAAIDGGNY